MNQYEMKQIAYKSTLKSRALQVLVYLIDRSNKEGTCYPAISTMSRELHISVSTVKRALKELTDSGFVKKESRFRVKNNGQTSNLYMLCFMSGEEKESEKANRSGDRILKKEQGEQSAEEKNKLINEVLELKNTSYCKKMLCLFYFIICRDFTVYNYIIDWSGEEVNLVPP